MQPRDPPSPAVLPGWAGPVVSCYIALPAPEVPADLRPVVLDCAASPFVEPEVGCRDADLAGDERDRLVVQLGPAAGEPAGPGVELQQHREPEPGRPALPGDQLPLVVEQRPVLDQLVQVHLHHRAFIDPRPTIARGSDKVPSITGGGTSRTTARMPPEAAARGAGPEPRKCRLRTSKRNFIEREALGYPQTVSVTEGEHPPGGRPHIRSLPNICLCRAHRSFGSPASRSFVRARASRSTGVRGA